MKAFVLVAMLLAGSGRALAEEAGPPAKAVKTGHTLPLRIVPQGSPQRGNGGFAAGSGPGTIFAAAGSLCVFSRYRPPRRR